MNNNIEQPVKNWSTISLEEARYFYEPYSSSIHNGHYEINDDAKCDCCGSSNTKLEEWRNPEITDRVSYSAFIICNDCDSYFEF